MDYQSLTFVGLATLGAVNVATFFWPNMHSRAKFAISVVAAFVFLFVPADIGMAIADKVKEAIAVAFAVSGSYKLATKVSGQ